MNNAQSLALHFCNSTCLGAFCKPRDQSALKEQVLPSYKPENDFGSFWFYQGLEKNTEFDFFFFSLNIMEKCQNTQILLNGFKVKDSAPENCKAAKGLCEELTYIKTQQKISHVIILGACKPNTFQLFCSIISHYLKGFAFGTTSYPFIPFSFLHRVPPT